MYGFQTILALAAPLMAIANPLVVRNDPPTTCNSGTVQCCNQVQQAGNVPGLSGLLSLLGLQVVADVLVGLNCTPVTIGVGGTTCQNNVVCCTNNQFEGLINLGCSPITINL